MKLFIGFLAAVIILGQETFTPKVPHNRLASPVRILDGDQPVDVDVGHPMPCVVDWDGDGKKDLLVGQFGDGKLRIYLNHGTDAKPQFSGFSYVQAGGKNARVPTA
jgi:hypothetical protein